MALNVPQYKAVAVIAGPGPGTPQQAPGGSALPWWQNNTDKDFKDVKHELKINDTLQVQHSNSPLNRSVFLVTLL